MNNTTRDMVKEEIVKVKDVLGKYPPITLEVLIYGACCEDVERLGLTDRSEIHDCVRHNFIEVSRTAPYYDETNKYKERY